jgi:hypothetical protein
MLQTMRVTTLQIELNCRMLYVQMLGMLSITFQLVLKLGVKAA